jgi:uncharacterized protein (DUF1015 family)
VPRLFPFDGLVYDPAVSGPLESVTAPPYDVISDRGRLDYMRSSPFSVVHLDLARGPDDPARIEDRYAGAASVIEEWMAQGVLRRSGVPCVYAYEMSPPDGSRPGEGSPGQGGSPDPRLGSHVVRGVICAMQLEDWGGSVVPHEEVREGPVHDRLELLRAIGTHLSPVYGMVDSDDGRIAAFVRAVAADPAPFDLVDEQGVRHRSWPVEAAVAASLELDRLEHEHLLIADGHHRYTTALRYRTERRATDGQGPWDGVMTLVVGSSPDGPPVAPFHRIQIAGEPPPAAGRPAAGLTQALDALADDDRTFATIRRNADGAVAYTVRGLDGPPPTVLALHTEVLQRMDAGSALRYVAEASDADDAVRSGSAVAAFLLPSTTPGRIRAVVERGRRLPPKSTYFWPKPRTGMVMMPLDPRPMERRSSSAPRRRGSARVEDQRDRAS